jgi:p-aminobenzoyl-glutamate transporter AbgT
MAQQTNSLREGLLAAMPQPENLAAYREQTAALLAKHARAVRWNGITANILNGMFALVLITSLSLSPSRSLDALALHRLQFAAGFLVLWAAIFAVGDRIYSSQVATLREVKQIQLQVLELQASLGKSVEGQIRE